MDEPVAIALLLSGSSAVIALALIGRRILRERAAERATPDDLFSAHVAADASDVATDAPPDGHRDAPNADPFADRISAEAMTEPVAPAEEPMPAAAAADPFAARISADAVAEPAPEPRVATPADADVFATRVQPAAEPAAVEEPAAPEAPAPPAPAGEDVFAARINPEAATEPTSPPAAPVIPAEEPAAPEAPAPPAPAGEDVFAARINPDVGGEPTGPSADPFARYIDASDAADAAGTADSIYPEEVCRTFAQGLKDDVLDRALTLFWALAREGSIDSNDLGALLGARPRQAGALVSTPMKRRAEEMDLPLPYVIGRSSPSRLRTWSDQFGIAERMAAALLSEQQVRDTMTDDDAEALAGLTTWLRQQTGAEVTLDIDEIDALGPVGLPEHAANQRNWWANRSGGPGHGHAEAWLSAGRLAYPDLKAGTVTFELLPGLQEQDVHEPADAPGEAEITR